MTRKRIRVTNVFNHKGDLTFTMRADKRWPGQIYMASPPVSSLTPDEAYALADALVDVVEGLHPNSA